uniref:Smr domain-containing protein n=1 Tax=Phlebotomus kandelakii TaxID=1109342 RepID=A0A6B2ECP2_9DIPT
MEQRNNRGELKELHEMFGECVPRNVINEIGNKMSWDVTRTVDHLIKYIEAQNEGKATGVDNLKIQYKVSECQENDRDVDVLIESENFSGPGMSDSQARSTGAIRKQPREVERVPNFSDFLKTGDNVFKDTVKAPEKKMLCHPLMEEICKEINSGIKVMILMRGLPGSGKTHLARTIIDQTVKGDYRRYIFSSDNFFYDVNGVYRYDLDKLSEAHAFNQNCVFKRAYDGWSPIIVDNTSMKLWEMHVYCKYAIQFGYVVRILEPTTPWAWNISRLSQMNKHSVPRESIERMLLKYEKVSGEHELLATFQMNYSVSMPQLRHHPPVELPPPDDPPAEIHNDLREKSEASGSPSDDSSLVSPEHMVVDWPSHEDEVNTFWNISSKAEPQGNSLRATEEVKEQRTPRKNSVPENSLLHLLKESIMPKKENAASAQKAISFEKHRKGCQNENESFVQVRQIYPTIPIQYLWDLFVTCKGDSEWTVDIILQEETLVPQLEDSTSANDLWCSCDGIDYKESPWVTDSPVEVKKVNISTPQRQRNQRKNAEADELAAVKRHIEEAISINDAQYSDHVKKIRDIRRGIFPTSSCSEIATESPESADMGACCMQEREDSPSSETSDPEDEMVMEVDLGDTLINHMENLFLLDGGLSEKPKDVKTTVFMPVSLLRQLHALWVESLFNQLEEQRAKDLMEDEEYARLLMMQDYGESPDSFLQDRVDIGDMADMEFTWEAYKREQWQDTTPQTLAAQLTRTKLHETFPEADKSFLDEILAANNFKFTPTVELLMQSLGKDRKSVKDNGLKIIEEMRRESVKMEQKKADVPVNEKSNVRKRNEVLKEFEETRNMASYHTQLKSECYQKAQGAIQKNLVGVAGYYNQVANLHRKKIDEYNHIAANCIVEAHNLKQNNSEMLDLHYLHVSEAIVCLDVFLDRHINYLRTRKIPYKFVFVITGRGLHSARGVPTIKNNAKQRLNQRSLRCSEVNPGLLKVKIFYNSKMSEET